MPFFHLDSRNRHKNLWRELVKDHPAQFEILEWSPDQERDHLWRAYPDLDTQFFPRICISIVACLQKLADYGGITVRGEETKPNRSVLIIMDDWKTLGPPKRLSVRGRNYPMIIDKTTIMASAVADSVCIKYRDLLIAKMLNHHWEQPTFEKDVAIM